jgi:hypothetical protein
MARANDGNPKISIIDRTRNGLVATSDFTGGKRLT